MVRLAKILGMYPILYQHHFFFLEKEKGKTSYLILAPLWAQNLILEGRFPRSRSLFRVAFSLYTFTPQP